MSRRWSRSALEASTHLPPVPSPTEPGAVPSRAAGCSGGVGDLKDVGGCEVCDMGKCGRCVTWGSVGGV